MITLQDVIKETGISYYTVVKYTGLGLLPKPQRVWRGRKGSESQYPDEVVNTIRHIKEDQKSGLTLRQIAENQRVKRATDMYADIADMYPDYHLTKGEINRKNNPDGSITVTVEMKGDKRR